MIETLLRNKFLRNTLLASLFTSPFIAYAGQIKVVFADAEGVGFNSQEQYSAVGGNNAKTLGEARKNVLFRAVRMIESQINIASNFTIEVEFSDLDGYGAITRGPSFTSFIEGQSNPYGILEVGRQYPINLLYSLQDNESNFWGLEIYPVSRTSFSATDSTYLGFDNNGVDRSFISTTLHELAHVMGFANLDCLGNCFPEPISLPSHFTKFVFGQGEPLEVFDDLSISEKEKLVSSNDRLLFIGSNTTQSKLADLLTAGIHNGAVELHADGELDGQEIAHFSPNVYPEQLMWSVGGNVLNLGAAAYILCDVGWCRGTGKVIDIALSIENTNFHAEPSQRVDIDFILENFTETPVNDLLLEIRIPEGVVLSNALLDNGDCQILDGSVLSCTVQRLDAQEMLDMHFLLSGDIGQYELTGELSSASFDVDTNGSNNLFDIDFNVTTNQKPEITLVESKTVNEGTKVFITASAIDSDNDELTYLWTQLSGPSVVLADTGGLSLEFTAPEVTQDTELVFQLMVSDNEVEVTKHVTVSVTDVEKLVVVEEKEGSGGSLSWLLTIILGFTVLRKGRIA